MKNSAIHVPPAIERQGPRRLIGLGVVLAVLMCIFVGSARGRLIGGLGLARPVGPAPEIGDCLVKNFREAGVDLADWGPDLPTLETSPCTGPRFGEVVSIHDQRGSGGATGPVVNPYDHCATDTERYTGIPTRPPVESTGAIPSPASDSAFFPTTAVLVSLIGPDSRQRAAGQAWDACVVYLPASTDAELPITLDHSMQGSWLQDSDKHLFSLCLAEPTSQVALNCDWPHHFEMIGTEQGHPDIAAAVVDQECRDFVVQALGSTAALAGGIVAPVVVAVRPNPNNDGGLVSGPSAVSADIPYYNECLVTATDSDRLLAGPLRGIGDSPVPLT